MKTDLIDEKREFLKDLIDLRKENLKGIRSHLYQTLLLSGAMAAFLMPVYASSVSDIQKLFIPLSITSFLIAIALGTLHLSRVLRDENRWLAAMQCAVEENDLEAYRRAAIRSDVSTKKKRTGGFCSVLVDILFAMGCLFLIAAIILRQFNL